MTVVGVDELPEFLRDPEPREVSYTIISVDDHVVEPPHTFAGRMPSKLADRAPRIVDLEQGSVIDRSRDKRPDIVVTRSARQGWEYEGELFVQVGLNAVVGHSDFSEHRAEPTSFADMRPGCYDPRARVHDMDLAGVWASMNFPSSIAGFGGAVFSRSKDAELGHAVMRAWNDWIFEEWYGPYPDRFIPLGLTWLPDPDLGAAEIRRNAARGFRAVTMPELPNWLGYPDLVTGYWDPILRACEETGTVVCLHIGSSGLLPLAESAKARTERRLTLFPATSLIAATEWLWSGVLQRFPDLKVAFSEGGIGWVPMFLDRLEYIVSHSASGSRLDWQDSLSPAEVVRRNFWFCSLDDPSILPILDRIGADRVMVEVDYPHSDSTWPDCQPLLRKRLTDPAASLSEEHIRRITYATAAELFRFPTPPGAS